MEQGDLEKDFAVSNNQYLRAGQWAECIFVRLLVAPSGLSPTAYQAMHKRLPGIL